MDSCNAIAKVRFASARAQHVPLAKTPWAQAELLCLEPGQDVTNHTGQTIYYVLSGSATLASGGETLALGAGHFAVSDADEPHTLSASGEQRLLCLALRQDT